MSLQAQLESLLFVAIKPLSLKELSKLTSAKDKEIEEALKNLALFYKENKSGLSLVENGKQYQLTTSSENSALIQDFLKDETSGELSQPSLEALTIIAYRGPIGKLELEKIRGVNCSLIIRNLLLRGLIEEKYNKEKDENYYVVTHDFIRFLGLGNLGELPDYEKLHSDSLMSEIIDTPEKENNF